MVNSKGNLKAETGVYRFDVLPKPENNTLRFSLNRIDTGVEQNQSEENSIPPRIIGRYFSTSDQSG